MKRRKWTSEMKSLIVLSGLKGQSVSDICNEHGINLSKNRVHRLMKVHNLLVTKNMKLKAIRRANTKKPKPDRPNQWWGIDMTKVMIEGHGWVYVTIVIDWHTKKIVGHHAGLQSKAWHWLVARNIGVNRQFPDGVREQDLKLMSDNGCQPTATSFMQACNTMGIKRAFTSYNNPKGNADTDVLCEHLKKNLSGSINGQAQLLF